MVRTCSPRTMSPPQRSQRPPTQPCDNACCSLRRPAMTPPLGDDVPQPYSARTPSKASVGSGTDCTQGRPSSRRLLGGGAGARSVGGDLWCRKGDLNPHEVMPSLGPQPSASTNSAIPTRGAGQYRERGAGRSTRDPAAGSLRQHDDGRVPRGSTRPSAAPPSVPPSRGGYGLQRPWTPTLSPPEYRPAPEVGQRSLNGQRPRGGHGRRR